MTAIYYKNTNVLFVSGPNIPSFITLFDLALSFSDTREENDGMDEWEGDDEYDLNIFQEEGKLQVALYPVNNGSTDALTIIGSCEIELATDKSDFRLLGL